MSFLLRPFYLAFLVSTNLFAGSEPQEDLTVASGEEVQIPKHQAWMTPLAGWEMKFDYMGRAGFFQEPKSKQVVYDKPTYRRNITLAVSYDVEPIDERGVEGFKDKLRQTYGKYQNFALSDDVEFLDLTDGDKGVLIYSFLDINGVSITQAHILTASDNKYYLATYTDMSERFQAEPELFQEAWNSMLSLRAPGEPQARYQEYILPVAVSSGLVIFFLIFGSIRHYKAKKAFVGDDEFFPADEDDSLSSHLGEEAHQDVYPLTSW